MYLKEIKAYGFKSFADKIDIEFGKNINGVVGPNGTGKSNIVDAVRWVLGEQSIKSLRCEVSTDVIFSGSASRKPLNSASVTLVFDNSCRSLPIDFSEVSIKRVAFRGGENEYYINNSRCRLKDITELLIESGAAKESFNIIGQGKIDEIISTKPVDRRTIFEEAAGVLKYKKRKEEALRKLDRTSQNINRVNDIISELNVNLEPLRVQSEKAKEYKKNKEELKEIEVSLITSDIENINNQYQLNKRSLEELSDEITILNNNASSYDIALFKEKDLLKTNNDNVNLCQNEILSLTKELEKIDADIRVLKEREKYASDNNKIESNIISVRENVLKLEDNIKTVTNEIDINNKRLDNYNELVKDTTEKYNDLTKKKSNIISNINSLSKLKTDIEYKIDVLENNINNSSGMPNSVKSILNNPKFTKVIDTIGNLIEVESMYATCISTSLQASSNYIVVEDSSSVKEMVYYLKDNNIGRATFFPLDVIKSRYIDFNTLSIISTFDNFINTADKLVKYDKKYENIILNQLGNVIIVKDIDTANNISKKIDNKYKIVTLDGQVVNVGGSITGGKNIKDNNTISLKYELDKKMQELTNVINKLKVLDKENKELEININNIEKELFNTKISINELIDINNKKNNIKNDYLS